MAGKDLGACIPQEAGGALVDVPEGRLVKCKGREHCAPVNEGGVLRLVPPLSPDPLGDTLTSYTRNVWKRWYDGSAFLGYQPLFDGVIDFFSGLNLGYFVDTSQGFEGGLVKKGGGFWGFPFNFPIDVRVGTPPVTSAGDMARPEDYHYTLGGVDINEPFMAVDPYAYTFECDVPEHNFKVTNYSVPLAANKLRGLFIKGEDSTGGGVWDEDLKEYKKMTVLFMGGGNQVPFGVSSSPTVPNFGYEDRYRLAELVTRGYNVVMIAGRGGGYSDGSAFGVDIHIDPEDVFDIMDQLQTGVASWGPGETGVGTVRSFLSNAKTTPLVLGARGTSGGNSMGYAIGLNFSEKIATDYAPNAAGSVFIPTTDAAKGSGTDGKTGVSQITLLSVPSGPNPTTHDPDRVLTKLAGGKMKLTTGANEVSLFFAQLVGSYVKIKDADEPTNVGTFPITAFTDTHNIEFDNAKGVTEAAVDRDPGAGEFYSLAWGIVYEGDRFIFEVDTGDTDPEFVTNGVTPNTHYVSIGSIFSPDAGAYRIHAVLGERKLQVASKWPLGGQTGLAWSVGVLNSRVEIDNVRRIDAYENDVEIPLNGPHGAASLAVSALGAAAFSDNSTENPEEPVPANSFTLLDSNGTSQKFEFKTSQTFVPSSGIVIDITGLFPGFVIPENVQIASRIRDAINDGALGIQIVATGGPGGVLALKQQVGGVAGNKAITLADGLESGGDEDGALIFAGATAPFTANVFNGGADTLTWTWDTSTPATPVINVTGGTVPANVLPGRYIMWRRDQLQLAYRVVSKTSGSVTLDSQNGDMSLPANGSVGAIMLGVASPNALWGSKAVAASSGATDGTSISAPVLGIQTVVVQNGSFAAAHVGNTVLLSDMDNAVNNGLFEIVSRTDADTIGIRNANGVAETTAFTWSVKEGRGYNIVGFFSTDPGVMGKFSSGHSVPFFQTFLSTAHGGAFKKYGITMPCVASASSLAFEALPKLENVLLLPVLGSQGRINGAETVYNFASTAAASGYKAFMAEYSETEAGSSIRARTALLNWMDKIVKGSATSNYDAVTTVEDIVCSATPNQTGQGHGLRSGGRIKKYEQNMSLAEKTEFALGLVDVNGTGMVRKLHADGWVKFPWED